MSSMRTGSRPAFPTASISDLVRAHGGPATTSPSSRARAMTISVPPGATRSPTLAMASRLGGSGSACNVRLSTTRSKARCHSAGGSRRFAVRYRTADPGNLRRAVAMAVGEMSKPTV